MRYPLIQIQLNEFILDIFSRYISIHRKLYGCLKPFFNLLAHLLTDRII